MSQDSDQTANGSGNGLEEGLGSANTQPGPAYHHPAEPDALEYGLGSPQTQSQDGEGGHTFDHSKNADESGLPFGLGAPDTQASPAVPHPFARGQLDHGLGSADTQHDAE
jgi:hypothetical protein